MIMAQLTSLAPSVTSVLNEQIPPAPARIICGPLCYIYRNSKILNEEKEKSIKSLK